MKLLILFTSLYILGDTFGIKKPQAINHRGRFFMRTVNEARIILSSGVIRQLEPLGLNMIDLPPVGPAANMFRMKWSAELESVAIKNVNSSSVTGLCGNFREKGYSGFYWRNDLVETVKKFIQSQTGLNLNLGVIEKALKTFAAAFETLMFIVWAIITYPRSFPIDKNQQIGPSEALYAHRYEIGCAFDEFALCLMRDSTSNGTLYEEGVACTKCPTHCEFTENIDGSIDEGDLCVPPDGSEFDPKALEMADMQEFIDSSNTHFDFTIIIRILIVALILQR